MSKLTSVILGWSFAVVVGIGIWCAAVYLATLALF
jgi:hypothetical protein